MTQPIYQSHLNAAIPPDWALFPTIDNGRGLPKLPALKPLNAFTRLTPRQNSDHDWRRAAGVAVALGAPSGGLNLIDVDHLGLADYLARELLKADSPPLMGKSPNGLHIFTAGPPSMPLDLAVKYRGQAASKYCKVQLLSGGCYAVIPPTPGYEWLTPGQEPAYGSVNEVWRRFALAFGMPYETARDYHFNPHESFSPRLTTAEIRQALSVGV